MRIDVPTVEADDLPRARRRNSPRGSRPIAMPADALVVIGLVLVTALIAFGLSAAIGIVVARLGLDDPEEGRVVRPVTPPEPARTDTLLPG
jgi:hypothetical protein